MIDVRNAAPADADARGRTEAELRDSEERLSLAVAAAGGGTWSLDLATDQFEASDAALAIHGFGPGATITHAMAAGWVHPDDRPRVEAALARAMADGAQFREELRIVWPDGTVRRVLSHARRHDGPGGPRILGLVQDVTDSRRAEERDRFLVALDDAVRPLTDPAEITATSARLLGRHLGADRCAYADVEPDQDTFNLTGDYTNGVPSIVGRYRMSAFGAEALRLARAGQPYVVEDADADPRIAPDLTAAYRQAQIRAVVSVGLLKGGRFVAGLAVHQAVPRRWAAADVELVQAVAARCWESIERARVTRELLASQERLQLAVAIARMGTFEIDLRTGAVTVNDPGREIYGWAAGEPLTFHKVRSHFHPDDAPGVLQAVAAASDPAGPGEFAVEQRIVRSDGAVRWIRVRGRALFDGDGTGDGTGDGRQAVRCVGTYLDVTDRKEAEVRREQLLDAERAARAKAEALAAEASALAAEASALAAEAERVGRMKDEFLATLSHELRTPLNAILGWAQLLRRPGGQPGDAAAGLETIERNARAQAQLIEDLLDMSRIVSGNLRIEPGRVDLAAVVAAAVGSVRPTADAKRIVLAIDVDPAAAAATGDAARLQQVLWNLLTNAVKFTPAGGQVWVRLAAAGDAAVEVRVTDTGQGIRRDFLPHVFDRFRQADASTTRRHGGLGLGLSIVKHLVELHGGTVRADSPGEGQGATFVVTLPRRAEIANQSGGGEAADRADGGAAMDGGTAAGPNGRPLAGLRVLIVDDEPDARLLVCRILEAAGAKPLVAGGAAEALELLRRSRPDLILSDIGMPGVDGYELLRQVRALPPDQGGRTPAVALTAFARSEDRRRALVAGFQVHVPKPVEGEELVAVVASLANVTG